MSTLSEWMVVGAAVSGVAASAVATTLVSWLQARTGAGSHDYGGVAEAVGVPLLSDRQLFGGRLLRWAGDYRGLDCSMEVGLSDQRSHTRIVLDYVEPLPLAFRVAADLEEGLWTRVLRMRENDIGAPTFDREFIVLTRNPEAMTAALDPDARRMLLNLRERVRDVRFDQYGVSAHASKSLDIEEVQTVMRTAAQLCGWTKQRLDEWERERRELEEDASRTTAFTPIPETFSSLESVEAIGRPATSRHRAITIAGAPIPEAVDEPAADAEE